MLKLDSIINNELSKKTDKDLLLYFLKNTIFIINKNGKIIDCLGPDNNNHKIIKNKLIEENIQNIFTIEETNKLMKKINKIFETQDKQKYYSSKIISKENSKNYFFTIKKTPYLPEKILFLSIQNKSNEKNTVKNKLDKQKNIVKKLHDTALILSTCDNEETILINTIEAAENILDFNLCDISLVENDKIVTEVTSDALNINKNLSVPITEGLAGKTYRENNSFLVNDLMNNKVAKPVDSDFKSAISIPVKDFGVFQAVSTKKYGFKNEDLELAEILISHMATALEQVRYKKTIEYKSFHDELTDTYNRRFFEEELNRIDTERQLPITIVMTDLNGLKIINDSHGHKFGDKLLKKAAKLINDSIRKEDILARFGGDEFAILLPKTTKGEAKVIVQRLKENCEKTSNSKLPVSLGIGLATKENQEENINKTLKRADKNMYQNKLLASRSIKNKIVTSLLNSLRAKSDETEEHCERMIKLCKKLGEKLNLSETEIDKLSLLASLHDIGKTSINEEILNKEDNLTEEEWSQIKEHPERGYRIATATEEFASIAREILCHHEHWDGKGYPNKLKEEEIPYLARIIAIVDAFDVMTHDRPYSKAISVEKALEEIKSEAGSQFDPEIAEKFITLFTEKEN